MDFTIKGNNNEVSVSKDTIKKLDGKEEKAK